MLDEIFQLLAKGRQYLWLRRYILSHARHLCMQGCMSCVWRRWELLVAFSEESRRTDSRVIFSNEVQCSLARAIAVAATLQCGCTYFVWPRQAAKARHVTRQASIFCRTERASKVKKGFGLLLPCTVFRVRVCIFLERERDLEGVTKVGTVVS
ncbi:hypothetical protein VTK73DRAFT_8429 [Phialemonium thermophilum]|uniref:Uncharacterized protein n=1 Tax=Phialemonium thermophilum TaxID=223376 RepID=A0ABR3XPE0_9PEZI